MANSIRNRVREALKYQLSTITTANGYNNTVGDIFGLGVSVEQIKNYPAFVVVAGAEQTFDFRQDQQTFIRQAKEFTLTIYAFVKTINDAEDAQDLIVEDVEKLIGTNFGLPDADGDCTCYLAQVVRTEPFGLERNKPITGVKITINARYNQKRTDPTTRL